MPYPGFFLLSSEMSLIDSIVRDQYGESAGVGFIGLDSTFTVNNTSIENWRVTNYGAGFLMQQGLLYVNDWCISNLTAQSGGFAELQGKDVLIIENSNFKSLRSTEQGAWFRSTQQTQLTITNWAFSDY